MKYYTIRLKATSLLGSRSISVHHTYAENLEAVKAEVSRLYHEPEIISVIEQGFDIGDRVVVSDHPIIDDEPGVVIGHEVDGWVVVEWKQFNYAEEFHWTELERVP
jgi:hypothetical protein